MSVYGLLQCGTCAAKCIRWLTACACMQPHVLRTVCCVCCVRQPLQDLDYIIDVKVTKDYVE